MFKIETFSYAKSFYENFSHRDGDLHIAPFSSVARILANRAGENFVFTYEDFLQKLFPEWQHTYMDIYLRSKIRELINVHGDGAMKAKFEVKIRELLIGFRFLTEFTGLKLCERTDLTDEQAMYAKIMNELYHDDAVQRYRKDRATLTKEEAAKRLRVKEINTVFVYQMAYVDASRMMLFYLLEQMGIQVVFRIPYDSRFTKLYEGWRTIYENVGKSSSDHWAKLSPLTTEKGSKFACFIEGQTTFFSGESEENIEFKEFDHPVSFKSYLEENPLANGIHEAFAVHADDLNAHIGMDPANHLFSLPQGKFVSLLAQCNKKENDVIMSYETFVGLMTSGWVQANGITGNRALSLLIDLNGYMDGVKSLNEIKERISALGELQEVSRIFDQTAREQTNQSRIKRYLANPFRAFSYVQQQKYQITVRQLQECVRDLERKLARLLLEHGIRINVNQYVQEFEAIYNQVKDSWGEGAVLFENAFKFRVPDDWQFAEEELFQLINVHLKNVLEHPPVVQRISGAIGASMSTETIHITDLSLKSFPEHKPGLPYLLTHTWLKKSIQQSFVSSNKEIRIHALLVDYYSREFAPSLSVYSLYHVMANASGKVIFSWIEDLQENDSPSMYFNLLKKLYRKSGEEEKQLSEDVDTYWPEPETVLESSDLSAIAGLPEDYWFDQDFCTKKFFLSSILEQQPIYENDLHQQLVFGIIGSLLGEQGEGRSEFEESIFPLFPQWTKTLKRNLIDTEFSSGLRDYKAYENIYYPKAVGRLQRLRSQYLPTKRWKIKNQIQNGRFNEGEAIKEFASHLFDGQAEAEQGAHCKMCPHLMVCTKGEFSIDGSNID